MPRPLRSPVREAFVAALLVVLVLALPSAGSPLAVLAALLQLGLLLGIATILAALALQRRERRRDAPKVPLV